MEQAPESNNVLARIEANDVAAFFSGEAPATVIGVTNKDEDKGALPQEPCRFCHQQGGVYFIIDDSPFGRNTPQVVSCDKCGSSWDIDGRYTR